MVHDNLSDLFAAIFIGKIELLSQQGGQCIWWHFGEKATFLNLFRLFFVFLGYDSADVNLFSLCVPIAFLFLLSNISLSKFAGVWSIIFQAFTKILSFFITENGSGIPTIFRLLEKPQRLSLQPFLNFLNTTIQLSFLIKQNEKLRTKVEDLGQILLSNYLLVPICF